MGFFLMSHLKQNSVLTTNLFSWTFATGYSSLIKIVKRAKKLTSVPYSPLWSEQWSHVCTLKLAFPKQPFLIFLILTYVNQIFQLKSSLLINRWLKNIRTSAHRLAWLDYQPTLSHWGMSYSLLQASVCKWISHFHKKIFCELARELVLQTYLVIHPQQVLMRGRQRARGWCVRLKREIILLGFDNAWTLDNK